MPNQQSPILVHPLQPRAIFKLTGSDRVRYLNGQITNQVDHLPPGQARYAVITNHKGQLEADLHFTHHPESEHILVDTHISLRETLFNRLDRYIIADDVELTDITDDWQIVHLLDKNTDSPAISSTTLQVKNNRFGQPGTDLWFPKNQDLDALLKTHHLEQIAPQTLENKRIAQGIPLWDHELTPGLLPPEARLEDRAIDYQKGCYIGQEIISRIKSGGKVNRRLVLLQHDPTTPTSSPSHTVPLNLWPISKEDTKPKPIGTLTSITQPLTAAAETSEVLALGYLKSQHTTPGTQILAGPSIDDQATTRFTVLPFPSST